MKLAKGRVALIAAVLLVAAGAAASTIRYAGPVEVVKIETLSGTVYETISRHATVEAALGSISDNSSSNRYVVRIPPGTFTLSGTLTLKDYVDLEGAGAGQTILTCACGDTAIDTGVAVVATNTSNIEIRDLTIINTGGSTWSVALRNANSSISVLRVALEASGSQGNRGYYITSSDPTLRDVTIIATGGNVAQAVQILGSSNPTMNHVSVMASGGTVINYGLTASGSQPVLHDVDITVSGATSISYGVYNASSSQMDLTQTSINASGGTTNNYGLFNTGSTARMKYSSIDVSGTGAVAVDSTGATTLLAYSYVNGPTLFSGTGITCVGNFDVNYGHLGCPGEHTNGPIEVIRTENIGGTDYRTARNYDTIPNALAAITDNSASVTYLVRIPPGVFVLSGSLAMKSYVDIEGSGQGVTTLSCDCSTATEPSTGSSSSMILGADNAELRDLTIENSGADTYAVGIRMDGVSPKITDVTVVMSGAANLNFGIYMFNSAAPSIDGATIDVQNGASSNYGVGVNGSSPSITNSAITVYSGSVNTKAGVTSFSSASPTLTNVTISVTGAATAYGVQNISGTVTIHSSSIEGWNNAILNASGQTVNVGATHLDGTLNTADGTWNCAESWDASYDPLLNDCTGGGALLPPAGDQPANPPEPPPLPSPGE